VVGTFGGNPDGGGASGALAVFICSFVGIVVALLKRRQLQPWVGWLALAACAVSLMMAEVKIVFLLLPLVMTIVLLREVRRQPLVAVAATVIATFVLSAMFAYYKSTYSTERSEARRPSASDYLDYALKADANPEFVNRYTGEVGRIGAPLMWLRHAGYWGPDKPLIGYGMTATRSSRTIGVGLAQRRFGFSLSTSSLTVLLWETGWLGTSAMLVAIALCSLTAWRLGADTRVPPFHRAVLEGCVGALAVATVAMTYNTAFVDGPSLQVFYAFLIGYVLYWYRKVQPGSRADGALRRR
jgi:hypothetical protein